MQTLTRSRLLGLAVLTVAALALAGCGGPKRTVTTTVARTTPVSAAAVSGGTAGTTASTATAALAAPAPAPGADRRKTRATIVASAVGFGVIGQAAVDQGLAAGGVSASGGVSGAGGMAGAGGQQCQNPFGSQAASNGQLICSGAEERLQCQCDANGCQLVPTGIQSCLPVGAVYQ